MARLNTLLAVAILFCALGLVTSQHKARKLFQAVEAERGDYVVPGLCAVEAIVDQHLPRRIVSAAQDDPPVAQRFGVDGNGRHRHRQSRAAGVEFGLQVSLGLGLAPLP